jgi:pimeloyl-ACP methyl ester carboxylesterase
MQTYAYTGNRAVAANKPAILFIHGAANDHSVWTLQSRYFAWHDWNALAVDLPGHGKSAGQAHNDIGSLANWVGSFMDACKIDKAVIAGHSMGSLIGLAFAARFPARVSKLVLVGTAVPMPVSDGLLDASKANDHVAYEMINMFAHSPRAQTGGNRMPGLWMLGNSMRLMERSGDGVLHADFTACNNYADGMAAAGQITCPVLLILGQRDLMTPPRAARDFAARLGNSRTVTLAGTGHSLMSEQPDAVLDALIEFTQEKKTAAV